MDNDITVVVPAVIGKCGQAVLGQLEAKFFGIVDHGCGSRYIQGSASPMGRIHKLPAKA